MNCNEYRQLSISDEPADHRRWEAHAAGCAHCAEVLQGDALLARAVGDWLESTPAPPPQLEARLADAFEQRAKLVVLGPATRSSRPGRRVLWSWAAAAAMVLVSLGVAHLVLRAGTAPQAELARALEEVEDAQQAYTRAIVALERQATTRLARAGDPELPAQWAAILLSYRDRLTHLDTVIDEVQTFLDENPGHSGGHTVLLAAYKEKSDVLREVIDLQLGEAS